MPSVQTELLMLQTFFALTGHSQSAELHSATNSTEKHYNQGLKNALVCSSVTSENFKLTSKKFNRAVSVQSVQLNFSHFSFFAVNT
jgi:hypothetical protein